MRTKLATVAVLAASLLVVAVHAEQPRPRLMVADPAGGCPGIEGAFVVLLEPARGMLLLSAAPFLGGTDVGTAAGGDMVAALPGGRRWEVPEAVSPSGAVSVWGASYPFLGPRVSGCVAFDKERFSSEGDLVTYARWIVESVYAALPDEERQRYPAFALRDRDVSLRVKLTDFKPMVLDGKEGAPRSFRLPGSDTIYLLSPFVLDEATGRVAVQVSFTNEPFWQSAEKRRLGMVIATPEEPGRLTDLPMTIAVESISAP